MNSRKDSQTSDDFQDIEKRLAGTLKLVSPPVELVRRLNRQVHLPSREKMGALSADWNRLFLVVAGVLSGGLLILTIARTMYYFIGRRA